MVATQQLVGAVLAVPAPARHTEFVQTLDVFAKRVAYRNVNERSRNATSRRLSFNSAHQQSGCLLSIHRQGGAVLAVSAPARYTKVVQALETTPVSVRIDFTD